MYNASLVIICRQTRLVRSVLQNVRPAMQQLLALPASCSTPTTLDKPTAFSASPTSMDASTAPRALLVKPASKASICHRPRLAHSARLTLLAAYPAKTLPLAVFAKTSTIS